MIFTWISKYEFIILKRHKLMRYIYVLILSMMFFSCRHEYASNTDFCLSDTSVKELIKMTSQANDTAVCTKKEPLKIDTVADATAKFIAGIPNGYFKNQQNKTWYKAHQNSVKTSWNKYTKNNIQRISAWRDKNKISETKNIKTVFYPFSGPDFLYANTFFPNYKNYIMFGLENPGKLPNLKSIDNETLNNYLQNIRFSLRYINKVGYFTTNQMKRDFADKNLDGTIHLLLFYLAKTGYEICSAKNIYLDKKGNFFLYQNDKQAGENIKGLKIDFKTKSGDQTQTLYYFRINTSNAGLTAKPGFIEFLNKFGNVVSYVKSGSYLLHHDEFSIIRYFMLQKSEKILQDDSGISYKKLLEYFDVELYGKYSKNISDFDYLYQEDLHKAVTEQNKILNFKLGYNKWNNETILMYARKKPGKEIVLKEHNKIIPSTPESNIEKTQEIIFKIQLKSTGVKLQNPQKYFKGLPDISFYYENGYYKYTSGKETKYENATLIKEKARKLGFEGVFTVAFLNGKKINVVEAVKLSGK